MGYWGRQPLDPKDVPEGLVPAGKPYSFFDHHEGQGAVTAQRFRAPSGRLYLRLNCGEGNVEWRALYGHSNFNRGPFWGHEAKR